MLESDAQRQRTASGGHFASVVQLILNTHLNAHGIQILPCTLEAIRATLADPTIAHRLLDAISLETTPGCGGSRLRIPPRGMLLALAAADSPAPRVLALIDCSVSLHSRQAEICFWALAIGASCPFVFVTEDRNVYAATHRSELGRSCDEPSSGRRMLESFTAGVYLLKPYPPAAQADLHVDMAEFRGALSPRSSRPVFDSEHTEGHTRYCSHVRPFDDLIRDLHRCAVARPESKSKGESEGAKGTFIPARMPVRTHESSSGTHEPPSAGDNGKPPVVTRAAEDFPQTPALQRFLKTDLGKRLADGGVSADVRLILEPTENGARLSIASHAHDVRIIPRAVAFGEQTITCNDDTGELSLGGLLAQSMGEWLQKPPEPGQRGYDGPH